MRVPTLAALALFASALFSASVVLADEHLVPSEPGALSGKTVVLSPGHGRMLRNGAWAWQRPLLHEIREDIHTNEIMIEVVQRYLVGAGCRVESCRERSFQTAEKLVDDPAAAASGTWTPSTNVNAFFGSGYRWARSSANESATLTFTPDLPRAGRYPVYVWFTQGSDRARDALYRVHHSGGVSEVRLPQHVMGNHWRFLGEWHFPAGQAGKVVLSNQGSDPTKVVVGDGVRFGGGVGPSGLPRWREGAKAFLTHKGFNTTLGEVTIRSTYATWLAGNDPSRWRSDWAYVSLHTNAGGGQGTSAYSFGNGHGGVGPAGYHTTNPSPLYLASDGLRNSINRQIVSDVQASFDPAWRDRGTHVANFGELRETRNMPSTLVELAFHDHAGDAARLRDAGFREVAGRAIYKGILRHFDPNATVSPLPPRGLRLTNLGGGRLEITWQETLDPLEPSAAPSAYKVYLSSDGFGFDDGTEVSSTRHELSGLREGQRVFVKVSAKNSGGEGLATPVGGARIGEPQGTLLVDGFDRPYRFTHDNGHRRYTYDYAVEHVDALATNLPAHVGVDFAANEALGQGLDLRRYALIDWLLGRESSATRTFDPTEQQAVSDYVQGGGRLFVSGSELGWDLGAQGGGAAFLADVLGARYVSDDAGARIARGQPGGPLASLGPLDFGSGRYEVASPDVIAAAGGAQQLVAYEASGAPSAGVGKARSVVTLGFPLEALGDSTQRAALTRGVLDLLDPDLPAPAPSPSATTAPNTSSSGAPPSSSTAPAATAAPAPAGRRSSGGGCSLGDEAPAPPLALLILALSAGLLRLRARPTVG
ncbi:MAG TPA: hypothetical protein DEA08_06085 [Planctomycetes bacterium]|nr:hypothetical protein [Planctomycetota bacterium]